jgi:hypothetical protein
MHCKACDKQMNDDTCKWNMKLKSLENLCPECLAEVDEVLLTFKRLDNIREEKYNVSKDKDMVSS